MVGIDLRRGFYGACEDRRSGVHLLLGCYVRWVRGGGRWRTTSRADLSSRIPSETTCRKCPPSVQVRYLILTTSSGRIQWTRESTSGEPNLVERGGAMSSGILSVRNGRRDRKQIGELIGPHASADSTGINELARRIIVSEQQRADKQQ